jgi:hypothetical protein
MIVPPRAFQYPTMAEPRDGEQMLLVETYGPLADAAPVLQAGVSLGTVTVHATIAVPGDEVVFYVVSGPSETEVRRALATRGVDRARIVPAVWTAAAGGDGQ